MVPEQLHEHYYVCEAIRKPLVFMQIVSQLLAEEKKVLAFCNSIDTVHRMFTLACLFGQHRAWRGHPRCGRGGELRPSVVHGDVHPPLGTHGASQ